MCHGLAWSVVAGVYVREKLVKCTTARELHEHRPTSAALLYQASASRIVAEAPEKTALLMKAILDADEPGSVEPQRLVLVAVVAIVSRI